MIRLEIDGQGFGHFNIDGEDIGGAISDVTIVAKVGKPTNVTASGRHGQARIEIGMPVLALIDEGEDVRLRPRDEAALIALGWTPPAEGEVLKLPAEWAAEQGVHIVDPDGWRTGSELGAKSWDEPISRDEFFQRLGSCTVKPVSDTWDPPSASTTPAAPLPAPVDSPEGTDLLRDALEYFEADTQEP